SFFGRFFVEICEVCSAVIGVRVPHTHEWLATSMHKQRHRAAGLVMNDAQVASAGIDRPRLDFSESVTGSKSHRIFDLRIVPDLDSGIVPPVEAVTNVAAV